MALLCKKISAFFLSVFMFFGLFGGGVDVKSEFLIEELNFLNADVTNGYTVTVPADVGRVSFNRVSFSYEATEAVRAVFRCGLNGKTVEEELLLSAGARQASMLLDCYLRRVSASRLLSVRFEPVAVGRACVLSVSGFTCGLQAVPKGKTLYLENDRYKAGVSLEWGGGLSLFEDKQNGAYGNLLNHHDTGRLVQQSYYGPSEIEGYENGTFGGHVWGYNPVQGGDQYGNSSKLVAVETAENEIRVVCRPLDWAQNDLPTQTYYTSVYRLTEDGLSVENTVVDFLQTPWPDKSQELPAFYTRSSGFRVDYRLDTPEEVADAFRAKLDMGLRGGMLVTNPIPEVYQMDPIVINKAIDEAIEEAKSLGIHGKEITPFLLAKVKDITGGDSLDSNIRLVYNNAAIAAGIAVALCR